MQTEYEIKVLDVDLDSIRKKLKSLGANFVGEKKFRRYVYDMKPVQKGKWVRLRTDGKKTTLACKHIIDPTSVDGVKEREVVVDSFEMTNSLLEQIGYTYKAYQENNRESYTLDGSEIELDTRPMIPPYLEIEGPDEDAVLRTLDKLDLKDNIATSENTTYVYKRYGIDDLTAYSHISFEGMKKR